MKYIDKEYVNEITKKYNSGEIISRRKNIFYKGHEYTLNNDVYYVLNNDEKIEYAKCYSDIFYFIEKYLNIKLRPYQIKWIEHYIKNRFIIFNVAKQTGYNSIISILYLHDMLFNGKKIKHLALYNGGYECINHIKSYYIKLPYFLKQNLIDFDDKSIKFSNGGYIKIINGRVKCISDELIYDIFSFQDFAHNYTYSENYKEIIPEVLAYNNNKLIITSTPNGKNYYYELYKNSLLPDDHPEKNMFKTINTYWYEVEGRDDTWKYDEMKRLGLDKFNSEFNLEF